jgi:glyoxylase-like metal-dependent hydrolase (beta-lactamase superfamily II)
MTTIDAIDVGYLDLAGAALAFLVRGPEGCALVECGPAATFGTLERGLRSLGASPASIGHLLLTHIHLDHAGSAGHLAAAGAQVHVHPFGAPHLVDPAKLVSSSRRVHGAAYDRFYGDLRAVPEPRVHAHVDGATLHACGLRWTALHTPGHARHHVTWVLAHDDQRHAFMGDLAGILVPGSRFIAVPTPPPEFEPATWEASLQRVIDARPTHLWLTHGGLVATDADAACAFLQRALGRLRQETEWLRAIVARQAPGEGDVQAYRDIELPWAERDGVDAQRRADFLDDAFFRMNLGGARRAFAPRA